MNVLEGKSAEKHIFVFSAAGKPIFSRQGDEQELVTIFGLLQAVPSIVADSGDEMRCIKAGCTKILYMFQKSLYFVVVSSSPESEAALFSQLSFLYNQILFILTAKVHDVLEHNASKDLRELLGNDTSRLMHAACQDEIVPPHIAFHAVRGFPIEFEIRSDICVSLRTCVETSNAAAGFLLRGDAMVALATNSNLDFSITENDLLLLAHFIDSSPSLLTHDQNWIPICLPSFNSGGYLQAYVAVLRNRRCSSPVVYGSSPPSLVLISASNDSDEFKRMHEARHSFVEEMERGDLFDKIISASEHQKRILSGILVSVSALQFFYKIKCGSGLLPAQCVWHSCICSSSCSGTGETTGDFDVGGAPSDFLATFPQLGCYRGDIQNRIWCEFQNLSVRLRTGSESPEYSLSNVNTSNSSVIQTMSPSPDHALAYTVFEDTGIVVIGLATMESEIYVAFPGTISPLDACGSVTYLNRTLRQSSSHLVQSEAA